MMHLLTPTYDPNNPVPVRSTCFLGIHSATNHKSQTQLGVWKTLVQDYYAVYNACHFGTKLVADADEFPTKVTGMMTDYALDQDSLVDGFESWQVISYQWLHGQEIMLSMSPIELLPIISDISNEKYAVVGGIEKWNLLSNEEKGERDAAAHEHIIV
jgi:hypothetical protein